MPVLRNPLVGKASQEPSQNAPAVDDQHLASGEL